MDILLLRITLKFKPHSFFQSGKDDKNQKHLVVCLLVFPQVFKKFLLKIFILIYLTHDTDKVEYSRMHEVLGNKQGLLRNTESFRAGPVSKRILKCWVCLQCPPTLPQKTQGHCSHPKGCTFPVLLTITQNYKNLFT